MKKCLFLGAMAAMLLGTASCSSDMEPAMGGEMPVSFSVSLGDDIDSRTISDGLKANQLKFAVFENGTEIPKLAQTVDVVDKKATVTTRLVKGHTYKFVFWAQNSACTAYDTNDMSAIKVDYETVNCNDESRDAFYKMDEITVTKAFEQEEVLTRPFAQINFLASDAAGVVNVDQYQSQVTVTGVPTTLNTLEGTVADPTEVTTYAYTTIPKETLAGYETYKYVAMNYVLAGTDKEMKTEVALTVKDEKGAEVNTVTVANCPVQRNYRTNIFGDLFTLQGKFNITIDPIYQGEFILPEKENVVTMNGQEFETIEAAYNAALDAGMTDVVMTLAKGTYTIDNNFAFEKPNTLMNVTVQAANGVDPSDITINGRFAMSASSAQKVKTGSSMTIKGLTLTTNAGGETMGDGTHYYRSHNTCVYVFGGIKLTVEDCIFNINGITEASITTWGDQATTAVVKNCVFNCEGSGKPIAFGNGSSNTIENCTFNQPKKYAVQVNHYTASDPVSQLIFKNNTINANTSKKNYGVALDSRQDAYYNLNITVENNVMNDAYEGSYLYAHSDAAAIWETVTVNNSRDEWGIYVP